MNLYRQLGPYAANGGIGNDLFCESPVDICIKCVVAGKCTVVEIFRAFSVTHLGCAFVTRMTVVCQKADIHGMRQLQGICYLLQKNRL